MAAAARGAVRRRMQEEKEKREMEEKEQQQEKKKKKKNSFRNSFKRDKNKPPKTKEQIEKALAKAKGLDVNASPEKPKKSLTDILADLKKEKEKTKKEEEVEPEEEPLMVKNAGRYSPHNNTNEIETRQSLSNKSERYSPGPVHQSRNNSSIRSSNKSPIPNHQKQYSGNNGRLSHNRNDIYQGDQVIPQREEDYDNHLQRNESRKSQMSRYSGNSNNNNNHYYDNKVVRDDDPHSRSRYNSFVDEDDEFVPPEQNKPKNQCKLLFCNFSLFHSLSNSRWSHQEGRKLVVVMEENFPRPTKTTTETTADRCNA